MSVRFLLIKIKYKKANNKTVKIFVMNDRKEVGILSEFLKTLIRQL